MKIPRCLSLILLLASPALAQTASPWSQSTKSAARLIGVVGLSEMEASYLVGVEIRLDPNTITYWRNPGDAGVPPVFDFSASVNVAKAEVLYPSPHRIAEAGGVEAIGYEGGVIFPVLVTPTNVRMPVHLNMQLMYAACEKICVPAQAQGSLDLETPPVVQADEKIVSALNEAWKKVPVPFPYHGALHDKGHLENGKPVWNFPALDKAGPDEDMFIQAPEGWYFDSRRRGTDAEFTITLLEAPKDHGLKEVGVTITVVTPARGYDTPFLLELPEK